MKKRVCRHHCELCNLSFETWDRYSVHFQLRGHLVNELNSSEKQDIELVGDDQPSFYPFPSELFFLLYSYAHNVSRPKVSCICSHYQCVCILTILKCKYFFLGIPTVILVLNVVNLLFKEAYYNYPNYY